MIEQKITIIGGGNLGSAIASGLIKSNQIQPSSITITRRRLNLLEKLQEQGVIITDNNIRIINIPKTIIQSKVVLNILL